MQMTLTPCARAHGLLPVAASSAVSLAAGTASVQGVVALCRRSSALRSGSAMGRFTPVSDPEKARCEQDENGLRKHRQFDTPFAVLKKDLNDTSRRKKEDFEPLGKPDSAMEKDEDGLWRKKQALFEKEQTWGRETFEYSNPEQARVEGNTGPKWGRKGVVGWGTQGSFGGKDEDRGLKVIQRNEVNQRMVLNEKGLWVKKKDEDDLPPASKGKWRCNKCRDETICDLEFCGRSSCEGRRPSSAIPSDAALMRATSAKEDPRMEAATAKKRGTADAAKEALRALNERRTRESGVKDSLGMMRRPENDRRGAGKAISNHPREQQVKPAHRVRQCAKWQGVQRSDEEAQKIVGKAFGGEERGMIRLDTGGSGSKAALKKKKDEGDSAADIVFSPSRSRSRSRSSEPRRDAPPKEAPRPDRRADPRLVRLAARNGSPPAAASGGDKAGQEVVVDFF